MKPKHQRLLWICGGLVSISLGLGIILNHFSDQLVFFYTPTKLQHAPVISSQTIRIGGLVKPGSITHPDPLTTIFTLTDNEHDIIVTYHGILPNLFREGQGTVAEGKLTKPSLFLATSLLTKHDEKYMPRELKDAIEKTGHWRQQ